MVLGGAKKKKNKKLFLYSKDNQYTDGEHVCVTKDSRGVIKKNKR